MDNIKQRAYKKLQIKGFSNYDFRSTYGTQLKESGLSSAIVADLMADAYCHQHLQGLSANRMVPAH